jgi:GrpB-like predicted nucleotidyltransferase (UPF0157 family)
MSPSTSATPAGYRLGMPFPDEPFSHHVDVVSSRTTWAAEGDRLVTALRRLLPFATSVEHIGSTSVPALPSKDCIDVMVQVPTIEGSEVAETLTLDGYRQRPEPWNEEETSYGVIYRKQVFAPAVGARSCNIHVREQGGLNVRYALLFRDYLRADASAAEAWGRFKIRLAQSVDDLADYGQVKAPAQEILMGSAERWAEDQNWHPYPDF